MEARLGLEFRVLNVMRADNARGQLRSKVLQKSSMAGPS